MDLKMWAFRAAQAISAKWDVYDGFAEYSYLELSAVYLSVLHQYWAVPMGRSHVYAIRVACCSRFLL
jgi:hypothetical protein